LHAATTPFFNENAEFIILYEFGFFTLSRLIPFKNINNLVCINSCHSWRVWMEKRGKAKKERLPGRLGFADSNVYNGPKGFYGFYAFVF